MSDQRARSDQPPLTPLGAETYDGVATDDQLEGTEREVLTALAEGHNVAEIADSLRIAEGLVDLHLAHVLVKLHRRHAARGRDGRSEG